MLLATISTRLPQVLEEFLLQKVASRATGNDVLLFCLSASRPSSALEKTASLLTGFGDNSQTTRLGCITNHAHLDRDRFICSLALLSKDVAVPFRSTILGPRPTQVGRWHSFRASGNDDTFNPDALFPTGQEIPPPPHELSSLNPTDVSSFLFFSDLAPQGLTASLKHSFPAASQLGLLGASTPFITGRPVTLFENARIWDSGAVGVAFKPEVTLSSVEFDSYLMESLDSQPMTVTESEGNMIVTLNGQNPTALLLEAIKNMGSDINAKGEITSDDVVLAVSTVAEPAKLFKITAGDPARGPLSLEDHAKAPKLGEKIMFHYKPKHKARIPKPSIRRDNGMFHFEVVDSENQNAEEELADGVTENYFMGAIYLEAQAICQ
ncbi:hypothetical protein DL96DRAFT_1702347 [Flagelloscypha sp. PMI_526]|nr:hypothetical protein DL96DRAFT_1702347 [Flagelloscypha sp. PMI_526]